MGKVTDWLDAHLIPKWRDAWRFSTVQLAALIGTLVVTYPGLIMEVIALLVEHPKSRAVALLAVCGVILLRLWNQETSNDITDESNPG